MAREYRARVLRPRQALLDVSLPEAHTDFMPSPSGNDQLLTIEEFERLPDDGFRSELVRGKVVREPLAGLEQGRRDL